MSAPPGAPSARGDNVSILDAVDEGYVSAEDEDFNPDQAKAEDVDDDEAGDRAALASVVDEDGAISAVALVKAVHAATKPAHQGLSAVAGSGAWKGKGKGKGKGQTGSFPKPRLSTDQLFRELRTTEAVASAARKRKRKAVLADGADDTKFLMRMHKVGHAAAKPVGVVKSLLLPESSPASALHPTAPSATESLQSTASQLMPAAAAACVSAGLHSPLSGPLPARVNRPEKRRRGFKVLAGNAAVYAAIPVALRGRLVDRAGVNVTSADLGATDSPPRLPSSGAAPCHADSAQSASSARIPVGLTPSTSGVFEHGDRASVRQAHGLKPAKKRRCKSDVGSGAVLNLLLKARAPVHSLDQLVALPPSATSSSPSLQPAVSAPRRRRTTLTAEAIQAAARAKANVARTRVAVTETVKFAGQNVEVTKYVNDAKDVFQDRERGIDNVVAGLDKAKGISTVEKTSRDWDTFKVKEGITDDLETKAKDGYVTRKEFLDRVDQRRLDQEIRDRAVERSARENSRKG